MCIFSLNSIGAKSGKMSAAKVLLLALVVLAAGALLWHVTVNAGSAADIKYKFTALNPPGAVFTIARGINARGEVVGTYVGSANRARERGFRKTDLGIVTFDYPGGDTVATSLTGINSEGDMVGLHSVASGPPLAPEQGFVHDGTRFTDIRVPGDAGYTQLNGINDAVEMVGTTTGDFGGFLYSKGGFSKIAFPGDFYSAPSAINDSGTIVGDVDCQGGGCNTGFMYKGGEYTRIVFPGANVVETFVFGINNQGHVSGYYTATDNSQHGFVEIGGKFTTLDFPGAAFPNGSTAIFGINDRDEVVGTYSGGDCIGERGACGFVATPVQP
jgi:uncharacterized membrane protein